jgi:transcriptional regulator with XRE-family HTH domain
MMQRDTLAVAMPRTVLVKAPGLRYWRLQRGYTQPELAERAGTTRNTVTRLEAGRDTRPNMVRKLAEALSVEPGDLMREPPNN